MSIIRRWAVNRSHGRLATISDASHINFRKRNDHRGNLATKRTLQEPAPESFGYFDSRDGIDAFWD
jgi:hypothetical protein